MIGELYQNEVIFLKTDFLAIIQRTDLIGRRRGNREASQEAIIGNEVRNDNDLDQGDGNEARKK